MRKLMGWVLFAGGLLVAYHMTSADAFTFGGMLATTVLAATGLFLVGGRDRISGGIPDDEGDGD